MVLYGGHTLFLTLIEEHRWGVTGNKVLRRMFGPKSEKKYGGCRKLRNEKLYYLDSSTSIITG
jgi:hypothetical protein